ncbi:MAG: hypothetical protein KU38_05460 [Sulfurovum sp. FS08-3]|nr:MAG: hypothetical protein KU38_05460 [Sulfurovum sp. FS08-3]
MKTLSIEVPDDQLETIVNFLSLIPQITVTVSSTHANIDHDEAELELMERLEDLESQREN